MDVEALVRRALSPAGFCTQCAELYDRPEGLAGLVAPGRIASVVCVGCGMTAVNSAGSCVGHNHGVDLRRKRVQEAERAPNH